MDLRELRAAFDSIEEAVVLVSVSGAVTFMNAAARSAGIPDRELPIARAARGESFEVDLLGGRSAKGRPWRAEGGELLGGIIVLRQRSVHEEELEKARLFLDSIIENVPDMIFVKEASELRFERFNRAGEKLLGMPRDRMIGKNDYDFFPREQADFFQARDRETLTGSHLIDVTEEPIETAFGLRWLHTKKVPILDASGVPKYLLGISEDITDRKNTEEALRRAHEELERRVEERTTELHRAHEQLRQAHKMEAIGRLAGGVAHDFNNMLAAILGCAGLMKYSLAEDSPALEELEQIVIAAERAAALTQKLLAFSRQQVLQPVLLDLGDVVDGMKDLLRRLLGADIELTSIRHHDLACVLADPGQMEQVILNLAVNARDAMPSGGRLAIETRNAVDPHGLHPGKWVEMAVSDTGQGMSDDVRARIFDPFFTTKPRGKGTGLGLSTVFGIIAQSRGEIRVDSGVGRGSTFRIYLPRTDGKAARPGEATPDLIVGGTETVLLVEDEPLVRESTARILRGLGYRVLSASNGAEAIALVRSYEAVLDLLLTDVIMPGMGGRELAARVRELRPDLRVLFMSGYTDDEMLRGGVLTGENDFLAKPFSPEVIGRKIRALLDLP